MRIAAILKKAIPLVSLLIVQVASAQNLTTGRISYNDARLRTLLPEGSKLEVIASGFQWAEGPLWLRDSNCLLFSDTKTQTIYRWSEAQGLSKFIEHAGFSGRMPYSDEPGTNGLTVNNIGGLVICEHGNRRIAGLNLNGKWSMTTYADEYNGNRFNSPNDVVVKRNGDIYFTDPPYGLPKNADTLKQSKVNGVYRLRNGKTDLLVSDLDYPNGIAFSPDEKLLYVSVSSGSSPRITAYPVKSDGTVETGKVFFDASALPKLNPRQGTDGFKIDRDGNIWTSGPGGLLVIDANGKLMGTVQITEPVANCGWGDDGSVLYITAGSFLYRLKTATKGAGF